MVAKNNLLSASQLSMVFPNGHTGLPVLDRVNIDVVRHEFVSVVGPSGCGKTTLLRLLAGLLIPTSGKISFWGEPLAHPRRRIGFVFQQSNLMPWRTVRKNIALPLEITDPTEASRDQRIVSLVRLIGLEGFEDTYPSGLSGGMAQRVAIARALVHEPDLLLLDEPFGSLDALTRERMGSELLRIWHARPATVIMVTHSIQESLLLADRVIVLSDRPARVLLDQTVPLPRPRSLDMSYSKDFVELAAKIRNLLSFQNKSAPEAQTA